MYNNRAAYINSDITALSKQERPNFCWDAPFFNLKQMPAAKKKD